MLLRRERAKAWTMDNIVRETRSSHTAVADALTTLKAAGFITEEGGSYRYWPATPALETLAGEVEALYAKKPATVIKAILATPHECAGARSAG